MVGRPDDTRARAIFERCVSEMSLPLKWVDVRIPGHIPPLRAGLERATGEIVCFLDDDAEPVEEWLSELLAPFADPTVGCVGGRVIRPTVMLRSPRPVSRKAGTVRWFGQYVGRLGELEAEKPIPADGLRECNWAWRRDTLAAIRFDPVLTADDSLHYGLDMCLQAKALGKSVIYTSAACVRHHEGPREGMVSRDDAVRRSYVHGRNMMYIGLKHYRRFRRFAFVLWWFLVGERQSYGLAKATWDLPREPRAVIGRFVSGLRGRRDGIRSWLARSVSGGVTGRRHVARAFGSDE